MIALSCSGDGGDDDIDESAEVVLPTYMDPPSANDSPKCSRWLQSFIGGDRPENRNLIQTTFYLFTRFSIKFEKNACFLLH